MMNLSRKMSDLRICIVWWNEPECGCAFEDILKPIEGIAIKNYARPLKTRNELLREKKFVETFIACFQNCFFKYYYRNGNKRRIGSFWKGIEGVTEQKLISQIETYSLGTTIFCRMGVGYNTECILTEKVFSEVVLIKLAELKKNISNQKYVGLHIRRTDHKQAIENSPITFFKKAIERELEESKETYFYLATDDQEVEEELRGCYGTCILLNKYGIKGRTSVAAMQDAAVDLLMLSGAEKIYGSVGSTFSQMAAEIGKKPLILAL